MEIERPLLRIIVSVVAGGIAGFASYAGFMVFGHRVSSGGKVVLVILFLSVFLIGPTITALFLYALTPREPNDGHTRCGKCGYILKGLTEPRFSECGERI